MITLAFYKGRGGLFAALIRFATRSKYSHVELVRGRPAYGQTALCFSSSERDGGVRAKEIMLDPDKWDLVTFPSPPLRAIDFVKSQSGRGYDWLGIVLSQILNLNRGQKKRWYCSEICAHALDIQPTNLSPGALYGLVQTIRRRDNRIELEKEAKE
ncbi:MAG: hypothetical protein OIF56_14870 [Cohaesibacter sp.]|nr:hypothetical protein [Cohaesibacter sp.]